MPDPRVMKLAKLLVHYSVELQKGQQVLIRTSQLQMNSLSPYMLCDMSDAEINMDGNLFYKNGRTLIS